MDELLAKVERLVEAIARLEGRPHWLDRKAAAEVLGVSLNTLTRLVGEGTVPPPTKLGRQLRWWAADLGKEALQDYLSRRGRRPKRTTQRAH